MVNRIILRNKHEDMMYNVVQGNDTRVKPSGPLIDSATTALSPSAFLMFEPKSEVDHFNLSRMPPVLTHTCTRTETYVNIRNSHTIHYDIGTESHIHTYSR